MSTPTSSTAPTSTAGGYCIIGGANGVQLVTNTYEQAAETEWLEVRNPARSGSHWSVSAWVMTYKVVQRFMNELGAVEVDDPEYGRELSWTTASGAQLRGDAVNGTYLRILDTDGTELDEGSAYWICDEWLAEPGEVLGAITGALAGLR